MWTVLFGVYAALAQLFTNSENVLPAYHWLTPECQQYVSDNIWQIRYVPPGEAEDPRYRHALAYVSARTVYVGDDFLAVPVEFQAFVLVHEAAHAEDWRLHEQYVRGEEAATDKSWGCYHLKLYGWPLRN